MIKVIKIRCIKDINFGKIGSCIQDKNYIARVSENGDNFLILTNKNEWANATNPLYKQGFGGIYCIRNFIKYPEHFTEVEDIFIKNKKDLLKLKVEQFNL